jgi:predicted transcriptional regulator
MKVTYSRMPPDIERAVDHLAKADDRSFSTMVRVLVKESLHARGALPDSNIRRSK